MLLAAFYLMYKISRVEGWNDWVWMFLLFLMVDNDQDRKPVSWLRFVPVGMLVLGVSYLLYQEAPRVWWAIAKWNGDLPKLWDWNEAFRQIPWNDGAWFRESPLFTWFRTSRMTVIMRWVYGFGFALTIWAGVIRSFFARDARKMVQYTVSTHLLQFALIMPFYALINLDEIWWVLGHPDPFGRGIPPEQLQYLVKNCFPSMHTSVAFAVMLLALRERGTIFKWLMVSYTAVIIYSTIYLEIHWLLDLPPGMLLGWAAVWLSDAVLGRFWPQRARTPVPAPVPAPVPTAPGAAL